MNACKAESETSNSDTAALQPSSAIPTHYSNGDRLFSFSRKTRLQWVYLPAVGGRTEIAEAHSVRECLIIIVSCPLIELP